MNRSGFGQHSTAEERITRIWNKTLLEIDGLKIFGTAKEKNL
jgi:hypothetical protein